MKKVTALAFLFVSLLSFSQDKKFSAVTGLNYSYFTDGFGGQVVAENSFGLQLGVACEMNITKNIHFRPQLVFSQEGDRTKSDYSEGDFPEGNFPYGDFNVDQIDYKLSYLNIPMDFKFWNKIYLIAGPQISFLISQKKESADLGKVKSNIDFGINLGTGFTVNKMFFEFGIYQGMTTLLKYQFEPTGNMVDVRNGYAKFTVGYRFK